MRREKGTGCITKLSGNRRRPYNARVSTGYTPEGRQKMLSIGCYATKKEAARALADFLANTDTINDKFNITFAELYNELTVEHFPKLSKSTRDVYIASYKNIRALDKRKFRTLRTADFQKIINDLDLKPATKALIKVLLGLMYKYAMRNDIVNKNYAEFIYIEREEKKEKEIFTDDEIQIFFDHDDDLAAKVMLMLIYSGLRISELLTLTIDDVDLSQRIIKGGLKTDAGKNRTVPLHEKTFDYWLDFCMSSKNGKLFNFTPQTFRNKHLYPFYDTHNMKKKTPHAARHTCATLLARSGVSPVFIKQILGHTDYAFTVNTYTHSNADELRNAMDLLR